MDSEDVGAIQSKTEILGQARMKLGEAIYRASQAQAAGAAGAGPSGGSAEEKVVDAEFEEVDEPRRQHR
jgi:molecular chaperone DnaK